MDGIFDMHETKSQLLADMVWKSVGGEIYAIRTEKKYPSGYGDTVSVAREEIDSNEDVALAGELPDFSQYDTVILIYDGVIIGLN